MELKISSVEGNRQKLDGGAMFGNAPRTVWQKWLPPDSDNRIELACRSLLIEAAGVKILCETGIGAFFAPKLAERFGVQTPGEHQLLRSLARLQVKEEEITHVILSHLHFDHAGGLLPVYQDPAPKHMQLHFPKARYIVGAEALARAEAPHPRDRASFIPGLTAALHASGRMDVIPTSGQVPEALTGLVSFFWTHGHTPGQMHTLVHGQRQQVAFCGDLIPGSVWLHLPLTMGYDRFPEKVIDEKAQLYARALAEDWLLFYTHDPAYALSSCSQDKEGRITATNLLRSCQHLPI